MKLKEFISSLIGGEDSYEYIKKEMKEEPLLKWDGNTIHIFGENWPIKDDLQFGKIELEKSKNIYYMEVGQMDCWAFTITFEGEKLIKNKVYKIKDYI